MSRLDIEHLTNPPALECEQCDRLRPDATKERARLHVKQTGHTVRVLVEHVTIYRPSAHCPVSPDYERCPNCAPGYDCERGIYTPEAQP